MRGAIRFGRWFASSSTKDCIILFSGHTTVIFTNNSVTNEGLGGALAVYVHPRGLPRAIVSFTGRSIVVFSNNTGGALQCREEELHELMFQGNANVTFTNNRAK